MTTDRTPALALEPLSDVEEAAWLAGARARMVRELVDLEVATVVEAEARVSEALADFGDIGAAARQHLVWFVTDERRAGPAWWQSVGEGPGAPARVLAPAVADAAAEPDTEALVAALATAIAETGAPRITWQVLGPGGDALSRALERAGFTPAATDMRSRLDEVSVGQDDLRLAPMSDERFAAFRAASVAAYASEIAASGLLPEPQARRKADEDFASLLPDGVKTTGHHLLSALLPDGDAEVGILWWAETDGDGGSSAYIYDIEVAESQRGRGLGRRLLGAGHQDMRAAGASMVGLNVFGHNARARSLYDSAGYRTVAVAWSRQSGQGA